MANWITNRTGAKIAFSLKNSYIVGADFGESFMIQSGSFDTLPSYPLVGVSIYPINVPGPKTQEVFPARGRIIFRTDLSPNVTYRVDITVLRLGSQVDASRLPIRSVERWREAPEEDVLSEGPYGRFCEIVALLVDTPAILNTVESESPFLSPARYPVLIVGGESMDGVVVPYSGSDIRLPANRLIFDGVEKSYASLGVTNGLLGLSPAKRLVKLYTAYPEMHIQPVSFSISRKFPGEVAYTSKEMYAAGDGINLDTGESVIVEPYYSYPGNVANLVGRSTLYRRGSISAIKLAVIVPDIGDYAMRNPDDSTWHTQLTSGLNSLISQIRAATGLTTPVLLVTPPIAGPAGSGIHSGITGVSGSAITKFDTRPYMTSSLNPWGLILSEAQHSAIGQQIAAQIATLMSADLEPVGRLDFSNSRQSGLIQFLF
jgi:hypothetical protein